MMLDFYAFCEIPLAVCRHTIWVAVKNEDVITSFWQSLLWSMETMSMFLLFGLEAQI